MSSTVTKDLLTIYLADNLIQSATVGLHITAITRLGATSNMPSVMALQNNHEEADTHLVIYAAGYTVRAPTSIYVPLKQLYWHYLP